MLDVGAIVLGGGVSAVYGFFKAQIMLANECIFFHFFSTTLESHEI
jgi:hypothetical protein